MDGIQTLWCYEALLNFVMKPVLEIEYNTTSLIEKDHLGDRSPETDCCLHQKSLKALFHTPLQFFIKPTFSD